MTDALSGTTPNSKAPTCKANLLNKIEDVRTAAHEIQELTHQLCLGLLGTDSNLPEKGSGKPDKESTDLFNQVLDHIEETSRAQDIAVDRLNYLIVELC